MSDRVKKHTIYYLIPIPGPGVTTIPRAGRTYASLLYCAHALVLLMPCFRSCNAVPCLHVTRRQVRRPYRIPIPFATTLKLTWSFGVPNVHGFLVPARAQIQEPCIFRNFSSHCGWRLLGEERSPQIPLLAAHYGTPDLDNA